MIKTFKLKQLHRMLMNMDYIFNMGLWASIAHDTTNDIDIDDLDGQYDMLSDIITKYGDMDMEHEIHVSWTELNDRVNSVIVEKMKQLINGD